MEGNLKGKGTPLSQRARRHWRELCKNGWTDRFAVWLWTGVSRRKHKVNHIRQVANMPSWEGILAPPGEYNWTVRLGGVVALFMVVLCNRADHIYLWSPYVIGQTIIFSSSSFFLSSIFYLFFFPRLISAAAHWMSTILPHMVWS